jgi:hypothetical protein
MELSEANITECDFSFKAELYLDRFFTASYKISKHFLIISEFWKYLHKVKPNERMKFKHTRNCCQSALFGTSPPLSHDGLGSHSPINFIPDNSLLQG